MSWRTPPDLGADGRRLYRAVVTRFAPDPAEKTILIEACRTSDELATLAAQMSGQPPTVPGSQGQPVRNPVYDEVRQHRRTLDALLRSLALPLPNERAGRIRGSASKRTARDRVEDAS